MIEPIDMLQRDERAIAAQELLDSPLLQEILKQMEDDAQEALLGSVPGSSAAKLSHVRLLLIREFRHALNSRIVDPQMLRAAMERRRRLSI